MAHFLGIDTSNYTTSAAIYDSVSDMIVMKKQILAVKQSECGLRQSDAVFAHIKNLPDIMHQLFADVGDISLSGVCVSTRPRSVEGSYMPAFLAGNCVASTIASTLGIEKFECSHQDGHIVAAAFSADSLHILDAPFYAFHLSGGTTEALGVSSSPPLFSVKLLAETLDLNAGQLIDRVGVMLGLQFPCGKALTELALQCDEKIIHKPTFKGLNVHLSGVQNQCEKLYNSGAEYTYIARFVIEYIKACVERMTELLIKTHGERPLLYAGGVMSNVIIREYISEKFGGIFASPEFSTDNAGGVAIIAGKLLSQ